VASDGILIRARYPLIAGMTRAQWGWGGGGILRGFKEYFIADLIGNIQLDISGSDIEKRTASNRWKISYLPIRKPVEVRHGDKILLNRNNPVSIISSH
jgi:hypothetical protein